MAEMGAEVEKTPVDQQVAKWGLLLQLVFAFEQAMLEAGTLKDRADTLITLTEMVLAGNSAGQKLGASRLQ